MNSKSEENEGVIADTYIGYAQLYSEIINDEKETARKRRILSEYREKIIGGDGGCGLELSAHAFKQIAERLEALAMESGIIYKDVISPEVPNDSLLIASNMRSFVITTIAKARSDGKYVLENSRNGGKEFRFTIVMKKWSTDKQELQFVCIVENYTVKTGYFNWQ